MKNKLAEAIASGDLEAIKKAFEAQETKKKVPKVKKVTKTKNTDDKAVIDSLKLPQLTLNKSVIRADNSKMLRVGDKLEVNAKKSAANKKIAQTVPKIRNLSKSRDKIKILICASCKQRFNPPIDPTLDKTLCIKCQP